MNTHVSTDSLPAVIALNGPPHSGKSWISKHLASLIPDAIRIQPSDVLYSMMQKAGLAPAGMMYQDFKKLYPDARERLIAASNIFRAQDYNVFERAITMSEAYKAARVVIIDNVGHTESEFAWYDRHSSASILIRLDTNFNELEPMKAKARKLRQIWDGDSRMPLFHHTMLTAYDSHQMILLLAWLASPLTSQEAGPYYGTKAIWDRYFAARESVADLFAAAGVAG